MVAPMNRIRRAQIGLVATLVVALSFVPALAAPAANAAERVISVSAKATIAVPNDTATIDVGVSRVRNTRGKALQDASAGLRKVITAVQAIPGVEEGDIHTGNIGVRKVVRGKSIVYRGIEGAQVTLHEPTNSGELIAKALAAGATGFRGPSYSVGNQNAAFAKALAVAFEKAKERAQVLANQADEKLGPAVSIAEGTNTARLSEPTPSLAALPVAVPPAAPGHRAKKAKPKPPPPTKPGTSTVRASVSVIFELLPIG